MKNKTLLRTNILVCIIILLGLTITAIISYRSNIDIFQEDIEKVTTLTSEGIYNQINDIFSQPLSVSLTMANDSLLKTFLTEEEKNYTDNVYLTEMQNYLNTYKEKYSYDSVFLVSTTSNRYYHFNGVDRVLTKDNPENEWYYNFLSSDEEYSLNVDNDEAKGNEITVFVNCRITDNSGKVMGVVGVGIRVDSLQELLHDYEEKYGISACLINNTGKVEISSLKTGYENVNLFDEVEYSKNKENILGNRDTKQTFWYSSENGEGFVVTRYEPNLKWHLIVESDTTKICNTLTFQLSGGIVLIVFIIFMVMFTIIYVIKKYNAKVIELTVSEELEYQRLLHETTEGL
ncbi:MAG: cache domain-containing protein, partial [Oscillospiraceae bacterium]